MNNANLKIAAPFATLAFFAAVFPLAADYLCNFSTASCSASTFIVKAIFPFQLFLIVGFLMKLVGNQSFWGAYFAYLTLVIFIIGIAYRWRAILWTRWAIFVYVAVCVGLYIANESIHNYLISNFFHALPPEPEVQ
jgi:hypothetical protein